MANGFGPGLAKGSTGDITGVTAGDGLSGGGTANTVSLALDLNELTAAAVADGDFIPIIDTNDSNGSRKEAVHDLATLFSGTGLTATNSVIAVDASQSQITTVGALDSGSITSGFGAIDVGSSGITTTGAIAGGTIDASTDFTIGTLVITDDTITMTPSTNDTVTIAAATNGALSITTVDTAAAAANIQITADGTVDIDSAGVLTLDSGAAINIEPASGSAVLIDGTVSIDGGAITGVASILEADVKIGEDDQTKVDFETADEIHFYAANVHQVKLVDNAFTPQADSDVDLGASGTYWKDAFIDKISTTGDIELGHASDTTIARSASGVVTIEGNIIKTVGTEDMWIPAAAMRPTDTNGCAGITDVETTATRPDMQVLDFDSSTQEYAQFSVAMPKSWNEGTVTAQFYWTHATAVDTDVIWAIQGVCVSDNDTIDVAYGTAQTVTDTFHNTAEDLAITAATSAITLGGTPAAGDLAFFQVYRDADAGGDTTNSTDARLIGVKINYTTNAATDA